jgi:hypothetical protein
VYLCVEGCVAVWQWLGGSVAMAVAGVDIGTCGSLFTMKNFTFYYENPQFTMKTLIFTMKTTHIYYDNPHFPIKNTQIFNEKTPIHYEIFKFYYEKTRRFSRSRSPLAARPMRAPKHAGRGPKVRL